MGDGAEEPRDATFNDPLMQKEALRASMANPYRNIWGRGTLTIRGALANGVLFIVSSVVFVVVASFLFHQSKSNNHLLTTIAVSLGAAVLFTIVVSLSIAGFRSWRTERETERQVVERAADKQRRIRAPFN